MATLRLLRDELEEYELPPFCMRCGEPAALVKEKRFSWGPGWVVALLAIGAACSGPLFVVALILIPIMLKQMRVGVPLCERHRNHWLPLQVLLFGGVGVLALLFFSAIVLFVLADGPGDPRRELAGWLCLGTFVFLLVLVFPGAVLQTRVIRPTEITEHGIVLANVPRAFVDAMEEQRRSYPPALRRRLADAHRGY